MNQRFSGFYWSLNFTGLALMALGLITLNSLDQNLFFQQLLNALVALTFFFLFSQIDYHLYARFKGWLFLGTLVFLLSPFVFGAVTRGSVRWVHVLGLTLQPSELSKPFLVLFFTSFLAEKEMKLKTLIQAGGLIFLPVILVFLQPDLGSSLVVLFAWVGMILGAGLAVKIILFSSVILLAGLPLGWHLLQTYQKQRIISFLNPLADPLGAGYNLIQTVVAVGAGQLWGRGLGKGSQAQLMFLPERQSDFIFATIAEEFGFLGGLFLFFLMAFLLWQILANTQNAKDRLGFLLGIGIFASLASQTLINLGMNLGMLPITGITLPLVSYGGSSLVASLIFLGIINNLYQQRKKPPAIEIK
jgi:rod shape determining protein RodA